MCLCLCVCVCVYVCVFSLQESCAATYFTWCAHVPGPKQNCIPWDNVFQRILRGISVLPKSYAATAHSFLGVFLCYWKASLLLVFIDVLMSLAVNRFASSGLTFLFREFSEGFLRYRKAVQLLASLDVLLSLAQLARQDGYCRWVRHLHVTSVCKRGCRYLATHLCVHMYAYYGGRPMHKHAACMHVHTHVHRHAHMHAQTHTQTHTHTHTHIYTFHADTLDLNVCLFAAITSKRFQLFMMIGC